MKTLLRHLTVWRAAWREQRAGLPGAVPAGKAVEFLPAVLEIQETPPSPIGRAIVWTIMAVFTAAVTWACLGWIDIVAVAQGKIIPSGYSKVIQPFETGVVARFHPPTLGKSIARAGFRARAEIRRHQNHAVDGLTAAEACADEP